MTKEGAQTENSNFILNEKKRWQGIPLWGLLLALFQISLILLTVPAIMKQFWPFFYSLGHPFYVDLIIVIGVHVLTLLGINLMMFCIYKAKHPFFEQFRSEPDRLFPWEQDPKKWNSLIKRNVLLLMVNVLFLAPLIGALTEADKDHIVHRYDLESWPSLWQIVWQVIFCSFCQDFMFYCTHRTLHTRWCFKNIHKRHHEYAQPVSIGGEFAHPIEFLFGNVLPFQFGPILLQGRCHKVTVLVWVIYRLCESGDAHSGYQFPWSPYRLIPFSAPSSYHNYHHSHNKGNYATFFSLWDTIFGTNKSYYQFLEKRRYSKKEN